VLRDRLSGSTDGVEYNGNSNHKKLLDGNAHFEEFDAYSDHLHKRNKGQTLRLYNPQTHQWSIDLLDLDKGTLDLPPVVGPDLRALAITAPSCARASSELGGGVGNLAGLPAVRLLFEVWRSGFDLRRLQYLAVQLDPGQLDRPVSVG
jgi:hypothetical protein